MQVDVAATSSGLPRSLRCFTSIQLSSTVIFLSTKRHFEIMETNLAATSAARKERLIALRKRKQAAEQGDGTNGSGP